MRRAELEKLEKDNLASYALKSGESRGRFYKEPKHPYRTEFQRDRDRIVHSTAFRRLQYKTQVFVNHEGDHYRTRLTHTMEAAIIARSIARALRANEDLTEAIALAHDLGHTPFGHSGEEALNELLKECGGFEHNRQCLRVVDLLERRYPDFPGLNLTFELREGLLKHKTDYDHPSVPVEMKNSAGPPVECQIVNFADEIAYNCHDIDDGLSSGVLNFDQLDDAELCKRNLRRLKRAYPGIETSMLRRILVRDLINQLVTDLVNNSRNQLEKYRNLSAAKLREMNFAALSFSAGIKSLNNELKKFLAKNLYRHPRMIQNAQIAKEIIKYLFEKYLTDPDLIPAHFKSRLKQEPLNIIAADYIAGMTDRFAGMEFEKIKD
ncbi:MAG: deoxyguanosinetriphosphate triphosphohydrolase [Candidatus Zixiibacteriota bacterium]|nr:MAG: deoxyguanosinetriphosphate triphosphohydrolase [candidate division Zixibacteria bacterium]